MSFSRAGLCHCSSWRISGSARDLFHSAWIKNFSSKIEKQTFFATQIFYLIRKTISSRLVFCWTASGVVMYGIGYKEVHTSQVNSWTSEATPSVSFSSCQQNLIKKLQIEGMMVLITEMDLIFLLDSLNGQK